MVIIIKRFTNDDVEYVKSLLNYRYADCDVKVIHNFCYLRFVLSEIKSVPLHTLFKEFITCLKGSPNGVYSRYTKTTYIFPKIIYKNTWIETRDFHKMLCRVVLIHELRHYFQHIYMSTDKWDEERAENDARKFEIKMLLRKYDELERLNT